MTHPNVMTRFGSKYFRERLASFSRISQDAYRLYHEQHLSKCDALFLDLAIRVPCIGVRRTGMVVSGSRLTPEHRIAARGCLTGRMHLTDSVYRGPH